MEKCPEVIDLCDVKTVKSEDTSATIPLDENGHRTTTALTKEEDDAKKSFTEEWVCDQQLAVDSELPNLEEQLVSVEPVKEVKTDDPEATTSVSQIDDSALIPSEVSELVVKECAIKFINNLVIYAINKYTEAELRRKVLLITPDIDPQINYRTTAGFQYIYERCIVLFYEALLDLTDILMQFTIPMQNIVILWLYKMVDDMCKAHSVDSSFLRHEHYIERLLLDFNKSQKDRPERDNLFFNVYQQSLPTPVVAQPTSTNDRRTRPAPKKPRKPRGKRIKTVVTERDAPAK